MLALTPSTAPCPQSWLIFLLFMSNQLDYYMGSKKKSSLCKHRRREGAADWGHQHADGRVRLGERLVTYRAANQNKCIYDRSQSSLSERITNVNKETQQWSPRCELQWRPPANSVFSMDRCRRRLLHVHTSSAQFRKGSRIVTSGQQGTRPQSSWTGIQPFTEMASFQVSARSSVKLRM